MEKIFARGQMNPYDAVIIGAGPAGLMAARTLLKKRCLNFLVIDSKKRIGLPLKCGEGIQKNHFTGLFKRIDYSFIKNSTRYVQVIGGRTRRMLKIEYLMLDRPRFEQWLAEPIKSKIKLKTECLDVSEKKDCLEIDTNKGRLRARMIIVANGCNYGVQKKFHLMKERPLLIPCYGGIFRNHHLKTDTLYFFFDDSNAAGLWVFPKDRNYANVGIGVIPFLQKKDIRAVFKECLKKFNLNLKCKSSFAGVYPTSGQIEKTYADRMLVCGNAAGQVYAGSGEGIYFALKAGQLAGITAADAVSKGRFGRRVLGRYERLWKKAFGKNLQASRVFYTILLMGFKRRKLERIFALPRYDELFNLLVRGKVSLRARIAFMLARRYNKKKD